MVSFTNYSALGPLHNLHKEVSKVTTTKQSRRQWPPKETTFHSLTPNNGPGELRPMKQMQIKATCAQIHHPKFHQNKNKKLMQ
jgi:hypothetical protein